jgi:hypothetical protein
MGRLYIFSEYKVRAEQHVLRAMCNIELTTNERKTLEFMLCSPKSYLLPVSRTQFKKILVALEKRGIVVSQRIDGKKYYKVNRYTEMWLPPIQEKKERSGAR